MAPKKMAYCGWLAVRRTFRGERWVQKLLAGHAIDPIGFAMYRLRDIDLITELTLSLIYAAGLFGSSADQQWQSARAITFNGTSESGWTAPMLYYNTVHAMSNG